MSAVFHVVAGLAIAAGLLAAAFVWLSRRQLRLEAFRARQVSGKALRSLGEKLLVERDIGAGEIFKIAEEVASRAPFHRVDQLLSELPLSSPNQAVSDDLRQEFLHRRYGVWLEPLRERPPRGIPQIVWARYWPRYARRRRGEGSARSMSVAEIPLEVYARDETVRTNVFGGLYLLSPRSRTSIRAD